jgi:hypothetical protein
MDRVVLERVPAALAQGREICWLTASRSERGGGMNKADIKARAEQDQAEAWAASNGGPLLQAVDPDGQIVDCTCGDCKRDAVYVVTCGLGTDAPYRMAACGEHLSSALAHAFPSYGSEETE